MYDLNTILSNIKFNFPFVLFGISVDLIVFGAVLGLFAIFGLMPVWLWVVLTVGLTIGDFVLFSNLVRPRK